MQITLVFLVITAGLLVWAAFIYNRLVSLRNGFRNAYAQIDVQLQRRHDLVPNLVETAKGYLAHERKTLEAVVAARSIAISAAGKAAKAPGDAVAMQQVSSAETGLSGALSKLFALSESYPDLKASQTMMQLSEELSSTENKISFARQAYNDAVMSYNTRVESVPDNVFAGTFCFTRAELLAMEDPLEIHKVPKVSFH